MKPTLAPLTSLRFLAAMLVLCQHFFGLTYGHAGVGFFFVLSGFILAYNYDGKLGTSGAAKSFFLKRFARIYPTHLVTLLIAIPLYFEATMGSVAKVFLNGTLLHSFVPYLPVYFSFNGPSWSISDEAFFYAFFPMLLARITFRAVWIWAGLMVLVTVSWMFLWRDPSMSEPVTHWLFYINPLFRLFEFAIGVALGRGFQVGSKRFGSLWEAGALAFAAVTIASCYWLPVRAGVLLCSLWFVPAATCMVYVFARGQGVFSQALSRPLPLLLGESSFMLYMTHTLVLACGLLMLPKTVAVEIVLMVSSVALSVAGYWWFEKPVARALRGRVAATAAKRAPRVPATSP